MTLEDKDRIEHDLKSAVSAIENFIKIAKLGESFSEGPGPEYVATAERAHKLIEDFVRKTLRESQRTSS